MGKQIRDFYAIRAELCLARLEKADSVARVSLECRYWHASRAKRSFSKPIWARFWRTVRHTHNMTAQILNLNLIEASLRGCCHSWPVLPRDFLPEKHCTNATACHPSEPAMTAASAVQSQSSNFWKERTRKLRMLLIRCSLSWTKLFGIAVLQAPSLTRLPVAADFFKHMRRLPVQHCQHVCCSNA